MINQPGTYPMKPSVAEGGYFLMADISDCRDLIPKKYLESHDYLPEGESVDANKIYNPDGSIPLDLAFCRWMACENGLVMMPNSFFYEAGSPNLSDTHVRMALCKNLDSLKAGAAKFKM